MDDFSNYSDEAIISFISKGGQAELEKRGYEFGWHKKEQPFAGTIYIFFNPAFPDRVKIGYSDNYLRRLEQLSKNQSAPEPFHCYAIFNVNKRLTDKVLHSLITVLNPGLRVYNEYFLITPEDAYKVLSAIAQITGAEERLIRNPNNDPIFEQHGTKQPNPSDQSGEKKANFTFEMVGIPVGSKLIFKKDPSVVCVTKDDRNQVEYKGKTYSLSGLAKKLLNGQAAQGARFFTYRGQTLTEMRENRGV